MAVPVPALPGDVTVPLVASLAAASAPPAAPVAPAREPAAAPPADLLLSAPQLAASAAKPLELAEAAQGAEPATRFSELPTVRADADPGSATASRSATSEASVATASPPVAKEPTTARVEASAAEQESRRKGVQSRLPLGRLVIITKEGSPGAIFPIHGQIDIGRTEGDVVLTEDRYLSPRHARIRFREDRCYLRDLDSVNGVFLRVAAPRATKAADIELAPTPAGAPPCIVGTSEGHLAVPLKHQDLILVGQQVLKFDILTDAEAGLGPAMEHGTLVFGTPSSPRYARLSQRTVEGVARDVYYIRKVETVLGRESGDVVFTDDPFLSRRHAAILVSSAPSQPAPYGISQERRRRPTSFHLVDLASSNGTFLGIRGETEVSDGDLVRVGQQLFRIELGAGHAG